MQPQISKKRTSVKSKAKYVFLGELTLTSAFVNAFLVRERRGHCLLIQSQIKYKDNYNIRLDQFRFNPILTEAQRKETQL